jgi:hypothetical protein
MRLPDVFFCSPSSRALRSAQIAWNWDWHGKRVVRVLEGLRERMHVRECERRTSLCEIKKIFGGMGTGMGMGMDLEFGDMTEEDELWKGDVERETLKNMRRGLRRLYRLFLL